MHGRRVSCSCQESCSKIPGRTRLFTRDGYRKHLEAQANAARIETRIIVSSLKAELNLYATSNLSFDNLVFRPNLSDEIEHTSIDTLLKLDESSNLPHLRFEEWCRAAVSRLRGVAGEYLETSLEVESTIQEIGSLHTRRLVQIIAQQQKSKLPSGLCGGDGDSCSMSLLEREIAVGIWRYQFPAILSYLASGSTDMPADATLKPDDAANFTTLGQLRWIDAVNADLAAQQRLETSNQRLMQLSHGLAEHRENILSHIKALQMRAQYPQVQVVHVMQGEFIVLDLVPI
jgi:hypothetical protein